MTIRILTCCVFLVGCLATTNYGQQQPRDVRRGTPVGPGAIVGTVVTDATPPTPLRRARVTVNNTERTIGQTAITNDKGEFSFTGLPPGRYLVSGVKDGYVTMHHGARRPNRPGISIPLGQAEKQTIRLRLPVGGVITGTVTDPNGLPAPGINVEPMTYRAGAGADRRLVALGNLGRATDDRGEYRIFGLPPGDYIVAARPAGATVELQVLSQTEIRRALAEVRDSRQRSRPGPSRPSEKNPLPNPEPPRRVSLTPVMYPGATSLLQAATVTLGEGEHRTGIDIQLQHVAVSRVEGTVFAPNGPARSVVVSLFLPGAHAGSSLPLEHYRTASANATDGSFRFIGIPPGQYTLVARTSARPSQPAQWASTEVVVDGDDVTNLVLSLQHGLSISGRLEFESEHPPTFDLSGIDLELPMQMAGTAPASTSRAPLELEAGGKFVVKGIVPGLYSMMDGRGVRSPIGSWWLKSIMVGGRDILDAPLYLKQSADDAVVTFTDRVTEVSGVVSDGSGRPSPDGFVVLFAADRAAWFHGSRRVSGVQPAADGRYRFRNVPPGDYFVIAHDDIEDGEWMDPTLLARLAPHAVRVSLAEFQKKALNLVPAR